MLTYAILMTSHHILGRGYLSWISCNATSNDGALSACPRDTPHGGEQRPIDAQMMPDQAWAVKLGLGGAKSRQRLDAMLEVARQDNNGTNVSTRADWKNQSHPWVVLSPLLTGVCDYGDVMLSTLHCRGGYEQPRPVGNDRSKNRLLVR